MQLDQMRPAPGSRKPRKRIGRGPGSGNGKTSGRGHKGQGSRKSPGPAPGFEGGQMPLGRRLPKRGFQNPGRVEYQVVQVGRLAAFEAGATVGIDELRSVGIAGKRQPVKILAGGTLDRALTVRAHAFSGAAKAAIESAGGSVEVIEKA